MSKIQQLLAKATETDPKRGESITDPAYLKRLALAVGELPDKDWDALPEECQDWVNEAADAINAKKDVPVLPDAEKEPVKEEAPARSRRRSAEAEEPAKEAAATPYKAAKGDKVKVVTKRGKEYEGTIVDPDDKGELVLDDGKEELGLDLERIESVTPLNPPAEEPKNGRRRKAAEDDEPAGPVEPEVTDTVELVTARDKTYLGNVIELSGDEIVIKTAAGEELEFDRAKLKSVVVKVKNAGVHAQLGRHRRSGEKDAKKDEPEGKARKTTKEDNGGVSVTTRARELMCDDLAADKEAIMKLLKKEGLDFKENTINLIYADVQKLVKMLRERKLMK